MTTTLGGEVVNIDLNAADGRYPAAPYRNYPVKTRLSASPARSSSRATSPTPRSASGWKSARTCRDYFKDHPIYYAGPAKTPAGYASGSFGPTTAGRMDGYVDLFHGGGRPLDHARQRQPRPEVPEPARSMAASISARSAARRRGWRRIASRRSRYSNIPNSAWRRSGASRSKISSKTELNGSKEQRQ